ncbi:MAG: DUF4431 domain-containing protein [Rhodomicrobium sp.]
MLHRFASLFAVGFLICMPLQAIAACLDLHQAGGFTFEGVLSYKIFPGSPNFEDVRRGDTPEPSYILKLDEPICVTGDDFVEPNSRIEQVQVYPEGEDRAAENLWNELRAMTGKRVSVSGSNAFGAHTGHHHAPLLLQIASIASATSIVDEYGTALTTVRAFYLALGAGSGEEAVRFVIPQKRASGPLSASAIANFYGNLIEPLTLIDAVAIRPDEFRVRYRFVARGSGKCNGVAIVRTVQIRGENLIESIRALNGC